MKPKFEKFFTDNYKIAYVRVRNKLKNSEDAKDIVADVFLVMCQQYETIENPLFYLHSALTNKIIKYYQQKNKQVPIDTIIDQDIVITDNNHQISLSSEEKKRIINIINKIMAESDELTREVIRLKILGHVTPDYIQQCFGINQKQYNKIIKQTLLKIKKALQSDE